MARGQANFGTFYNRWQIAKHPTAHFLTDGTLPSKRWDIFQPMACCQAPNSSFFNRWHAAKLNFNRWHVPSTQRLIFQPMARGHANFGTFYNRWLAAKHPTAHFTTDGMLPSTQRLIF